MLTTFLNLYLPEPFQRLKIVNQISTSRYLSNRRDFLRTTDYFIVVVCYSASTLDRTQLSNDLHNVLLVNLKSIH